MFVQDATSLNIRTRLYCGKEIAMGPGKADLLEAIRDHGSISAAARALGMSYRRAWLLVDTMNRCWTEALVETFPGSAHGQGARISPFGEEVLRGYRALEALLDGAGQASDFAKLADGLRAEPKPSRHA